MTYVPPVRINSADDLEAAVKWAGEDEKNRWYVARMARAYKRSDLIPKDWDVTESEQPNERRLTSEQAMIDSAVVDDAVEHEAPITAAAGKKRRTQKIQTQAGVKRYGAPIGTPIIKKDGKLVADTSAVVRLRSETGDEKASPKAPNNKIVATPPENLEEGDEIVTKKGVELVVVSSTANDKGGYTVVVEDADGLAQSFDIDKSAKIQLLEDDDEPDDDAPETPAKSAREKLDDDFKESKVSVTEYARKKGLIDTAEIQDGQAKGEIKADDDLTAADVNAAYKRWNDLKKAKAPAADIARAERQYKHVHKAVVNKPAPEKGAPKPEDLGEDTRDTATKAKHDAYDAARAKDFKGGPAAEPETAKPTKTKPTVDEVDQKYRAYQRTPKHIGDPNEDSDLGRAEREYARTKAEWETAIDRMEENAPENDRTPEAARLRLTVSERSLAAAEAEAARDKLAESKSRPTDIAKRRRENKTRQANAKNNIKKHTRDVEAAEEDRKDSEALPWKAVGETSTFSHPGATPGTGYAAAVSKNSDGTWSYSVEYDEPVRAAKTGDGYRSESAAKIAVAQTLGTETPDQLDARAAKSAGRDEHRAAQKTTAEKLAAFTAARKLVGDNGYTEATPGLEAKRAMRNVLITASDYADALENEDAKAKAIGEYGPSRGQLQQFIGVRDSSKPYIEKLDKDIAALEKPEPEPAAKPAAKKAKTPLEYDKNASYYHRNSWNEEVTPDDDTVVWNAHRPLRGQQFEGQSRYGVHYASAKRSDPDFDRIAEENRKLDAKEITLVDNNDLLDLHESERAQNNGRYSVQTYLENDLPVSESMNRLSLPWDKSDTSADARIEAMKNGTTSEPEKPAKPAGRDYKAEQQARTVDREKAAADKAALELTKTHRAAIARVKDAVAEKDLSKRLPIIQSIVDELQTARDNADPNPDVSSSGDIPLSTMHHPDVRKARDAIDADLTKAKSALADTERKIAAAKPAPAKPAPAKKATSVADTVARDGVDAAVYDAVKQLQAEPGAWVSLRRLRDHVGDAIPRDQLDKSIVDMFGRGVGRGNLSPEANQKALTQADRDAAIRSGGQDRHNVQVNPNSERPAAVKPETAPEPAAAPKKTSPRIEELNTELERTRAEWREKNDAIATISDKNSREYAQAKFEALVAKVKAGRAYADHMSAVYDAGDGPRGAAYDDKRAAWSRNMDMTNQAIAAVTKELAAYDKRDAELRRQGFGTGEKLDHGTLQLPLNGRNGRGFTNAQIDRGVAVSRNLERATQEARTAELRAKESAPSESHDPAGERDPQRMRDNANYGATLEKWMGQRPIEFEMEYDSARREAKKAGDDNTAKAKRARLNLAIITAIGEDTGMVKNGRIKRNQGNSSTLREVADKAPAAKKPTAEDRKEAAEQKKRDAAEQRKKAYDARMAEIMAENEAKQKAAEDAKAAAAKRESAGYRVGDVVKVTLDRNNLKWTVTDIKENGDVTLTSEKYQGMGSIKDIPAASVAKRVSYAAVDIDADKVDTAGFATTDNELKLGDIVQLGQGSREYRISAIRNNGDTELTQLTGANDRRVIGKTDFNKLIKISDDYTNGEARGFRRVEGSSVVEQQFETQEQRINRVQAERLAEHPVVKREFFGIPREKAIEQIAQNTAYWALQISRSDKPEIAATWDNAKKYALEQEEKRGTPFDDSAARDWQTRRSAAAEIARKHYGADLTKYTDAQLEKARREALDIGGGTATEAQHKRALTNMFAGQKNDIPADKATAYDIENRVLQAVAIERQRRIDDPDVKTPTVVTLTDLLGGNKDSRAEKLKELTPEQLDAAQAKSYRISSQLKERGRVGDYGPILRHERLQASILDEKIRRGVADGSRKIQELTDENVVRFLSGESYETGELAREFGVTKATMQRRLSKLRNQGVIESSVDEDVAGTNGTTSISGGRSRVSDLNWMLTGGREGNVDEALAKLNTTPEPAAPPKPLDARAQAMATAKATARRVYNAEGLAPAIYDTIRELAPADKPNGYVSLTRLREALGDIDTRENIDETLRSFGRGSSDVGASLIPEENQKTLTQADRDNGVAIGGKTSHLIALDEYSTRPTAAKAAPAAPATPTAPAAPSFDGITPDDAAELIATGLSDTEVKNALSARYPSEREQKAFNRGWERSRDPRRKDFDAYTNGMNLAEEKAFSDGWQAVLANPAPRTTPAVPATPAVSPVAQRRRDIIDGARNPDPVVDTPADAAADASKREYDLDQALDGKVDATGEPLTAGKQYRVNRGSKAWVIDSINKDGKSFTMVGAEPDSTGKSRRRLKVTPAMMKPFTEPSSPSTPDVPSTPNTPATDAPNLDGLKDNNGNALDPNTTYALNNRGGRGWTIDSVTDTGLINLSIPSGTDGKRRRWNVDPKKLRPVGGTATPAEPTPTPAPAPEPLASDDQLAALRARLAERTAETPSDTAERQTRERANALGALQQEARSLEDVLTTNAAAEAEVEAAQSTGDTARIDAAQLRHARTQKDAIMARSDYRRALREAKIAGVPGDELPDTPAARPVPTPAPARPAPAERERQARRLANRREQERFDKLANERLDDPAAELAAAEAAYASIRGDRVRVGLIAPVMQRLTEARAAMADTAEAERVAKRKADKDRRAYLNEAYRKAATVRIDNVSIADVQEGDLIVAEGINGRVRRATPNGNSTRVTWMGMGGQGTSYYTASTTVSVERPQFNEDGTYIPAPPREKSAKLQALEARRAERAAAANPSAAPKPEPVAAKPEAPAAPTPEPPAEIPTPAGATKAPTHKVGQTSRVLNVLLRTNQRKIDEINERITNGDATADDRASLKLYEREIQKLRGEVARGEWQSPDALVERAIANGTPEAPARKTVADMDIDELTKAVNDPNATDAQIDAALAEIERRDAAEAAANAPGPIAGMTMDELEAFINSPDTSETDMLAAIDEMDRRERGNDDEPDGGGTPAPEPDDYTPIDTGWGASDPSDDDDETSEILRLIETGMNPMEAEAQVTGKKVETIMRRDGLRWLRETYTISDTNRFEDALTEAYQQAVHEAITDSEKYTAGGYHINMGARTRGNISERTSDLFTQNETTAMANASHELREFWDANGRITKDGFRNRVWAAIGAPRAGTGQYSSGAAGGFLQ